MTDDGASATDVFLEIEGVWKSYADFIALRDISLKVYEGEFVCFLGPSGCGKTTLLRAIAGLDPQTSGRITQAGRDISALPPAQRDFGIVFQSYALFPNLTVRANIAYGLENTGVARPRIAERVNELLELVGLPTEAQKYPAQLSGGQQQRIALARAIATSPGLLLLDEPLSALDAKVRVHLRHEIKELQRTLGVTTVMVTHDQEEALSMADRLVVMNHGVIEQIGTPLQIYRDPASLFVADFIGAMNQMPARAGDGDRVQIGSFAGTCCGHSFEAGTSVVATIRPEDIMPVEGDRGERSNNVISAKIEDMEFLGSFFRSSISSPELGDTVILANFSINAVRRLDLTVGNSLRIELPARRLKAFPEGRS